MLQRNPRPDPVDVPTIPATVQPGETVDWPEPIVGFELVEPEPSPDPAPEPPAKPTKARAAAPEGSAQ